MKTRIRKPKFQEKVVFSVEIENENLESTYYPESEEYVEAFIGSMLKNIEHIEQIQVEVENTKELKEALSLGVKNILLDNFSVEDCKKSVELNHGEALLEASGNINEKNILHYARTGVDRISIGAITKNIRSIDFSMLFSPQKPL